jgi:hypothetical protein
MGWISQPRALRRHRRRLLPAIEINDFGVSLINLKREPAGLRNRDVSAYGAAADTCLSLPTRYGPDLAFLLHILEEGDDPTHFRNDRRLQTGSIVI